MKKYNTIKIHMIVNDIKQLQSSLVTHQKDTSIIIWNFKKLENGDKKFKVWLTEKAQIFANLFCVLS